MFGDIKLLTCIFPRCRGPKVPPVYKDQEDHLEIRLEWLGQVYSVKRIILYAMC